MRCMAETGHRSLRSSRHGYHAHHERRRSPRLRSSFLGWALLVVPVLALSLWILISRIQTLLSQVQIYKPAGVALCRANFLAIHSASLAYAKRNDGAFPPTLDALVKTGDIVPLQLLCVEGGGRYVYVDGQMTSHNPVNVLMYEPPDGHASQYGNVLFVNGRVEAMRWPDLTAALDRTRANGVASATRPTTRPATAPATTSAIARRRPRAATSAPSGDSASP